MPQPRGTWLGHTSFTQFQWLSGAPTQQQTSLTSPAGIVYTFRFSCVLICLVMIYLVQQGYAQMSQMCRSEILIFLCVNMFSDDLPSSAWICSDESDVLARNSNRLWFYLIVSNCRINDTCRVATVALDECACHCGSRLMCHCGSRLMCHCGSRLMCHCGSRLMCYCGSRLMCFSTQIWSTNCCSFAQMCSRGLTVMWTNLRFGLQHSLNLWLYVSRT